MSWRVAALSLIAPVVAMFALPAVSDDRRGGELGVTIGVVAADENLTAKSDVVEGVVGLRGGSVFSSRWGWYVDFLHANIENQAGLGDASTFVGRTGFDVLFAPEKDARWLLTFGAGWMAVDFDRASAEDFHNPIASAGFGQRVRVGPSLRFRWELRVDTTLDDARLAGEDLIMGYALFSFNWGPRGQVRGATGISTGHDHDGDGVRNQRDRCPDTPAGSQVAANGCPLDDDRDGVPNGIDECPRTRRGETVDGRGCQKDSDGDGVPDLTDFCANTPDMAQVDAWGCPKDGDGDTIYDGMDRCPATPLGARVDGEGCPTDSDSDGVFDGLDRCPDTPPGTPIDEDGCPN